MHTGGIVVMLVTQSCPTLCDPWTVACQAPSSVHWIHQARIRSGLPFPSPENLPDPGIEPGSPALQADSLPFELQERPSPPFYQVTQFLWIAHAFQRHTWNVVKLLFCSCSFVSAAAKSLQSCRTLCDPIDGSSPGSPVPGILQVRTLEWVSISFSNAWK